MSTKPDTLLTVWASYRELVAKGVSFNSEPVTVTTGLNAGAVVAYFLDPDGFTLEFYQPAPPPT